MNEQEWIEARLATSGWFALTIRWDDSVCNVSVWQSADFRVFLFVWPDGAEAVFLDRSLKGQPRKTRFALTDMMLTQLISEHSERARTRTGEAG
ncbi:MAG: hypothetical protein GXP27_00810 [Planctomycetes bacterium]|nr:hypothetical protein [Planctomycetota bacterium]